MSKFGYGNNGTAYNRGVTIHDLVTEANEAAQDRCAYMKGQLIDLIGEQGVDVWIDETMPDHNITWQEAENYYRAELDRYECECEPDGPTCPGCKKIYDAQKEN